MGTLGKILLFINLLLALGLIYLISLDWSARQNITQSALRHQLLLEGLPVATDSADDDEDSVALNFTLEGGEVVETVDPKVIESHFAGANGGTLLGTSGSNAVTSRLAEVKRAQDKLNSHVAGLNEIQQLEFLCGQYVNYAPNRSRPNDTVKVFSPGLLARLALTYEEREAIITLLDIFELRQNGSQAVIPQKLAENSKTAQDLLKNQFERLFNPPNPSLAGEQAEALLAAARKFVDPAVGMAAARNDYVELLRSLDGLATHSEVDRKALMAHLLVLLDPSAEWQQRTALVLGLNDYRQALLEQTDRLDSMAKIAKSFIRLDQAGYDARYSILLQQARMQQDLVIAQRKQLADLKLLHADNEELVVVRNSQLQGREQALAEVQNKLTERLTAQTDVENRLFQLQQRFRETLQANFDLEDKLRQVEESRTQGN